MLFNSVDFLLFIVLFFGLWPLMRRRDNLRWGYLVVSSFVFYGWWDWRFLFLIAASGLVDFLAGLGMERWRQRKKLLLIGSLAVNLGTLAVFKYLDFAIENLNGLAGLVGIDGSVNRVGLMLPVGISFYTFQSMSYTIDVYRGRLKATRNVGHFFAYLAMFPQLVAGPIVRATDMLGQLKTVSYTTEQGRFEGLRLIAHGFFKKVVIADNLAPIVTMAFAGETISSTVYWWIIMVMFAFQIYCDFSGYSDIARGLGKWMGYELPINFNRPYLSGSFREFWGRWHISLSSWFRDYVYIPLGGSRKSAAAGYGSLWITMLLSGLWHGASWTFVGWAVLHSFYLSVERLTKWPGRLGRVPGGKHAAVLVVFGMTTVAWVFFRAESFAQAGGILGVMFSWQSAEADVFQNLLSYKALVILALMVGREMYCYFKLPLNPDWGEGLLARVAQPTMVAVVLLVCVYLRGPGSEFIYFQF